MNRLHDRNSLFSEGDLKTSATVREWKVLIVDDDPEVHQATILALAGAPILDRPVRFLHACGAKQAIELLRTESDIAVILLDVVIAGDDGEQTPLAGLELAMRIREDLDLRDLRIILRTAAPGYAPTVDAIRDDDINDYKTGAELAGDGLYAALTSSIRSYAQIHALSVGRRGLDQIIQASGRMMTHPRRRDFAAAILSEIGGLLRQGPEGLVCSREQNGAPDEIRIMAAAGRFAPALDQAPKVLADLPEHTSPGAAALTAALTQALDERRNVFGEHSSVLFFAGESGNDLAAYLEAGHPLDEIDRRLLEVFAATITINLNNVELFEQLHDQAYLDPLLHIPNRLAFMHAVGDALAAPILSATVAIVDIDHFSHLNDALGYRYGDTLLKGVAQLLRTGLPAGTLVARMAADTFGVLGDSATITPQTILPLFRDPFVAEGTEQRLSVTIGLVRLTEVDGNASDAIKSANIALNLAKHHRRGEGVYFTRRMELETRARMRLLRELRAAFEQQRLYVDYQPQVCLKTHRLIGVEALVRWRGDDGRCIPPGEFIALAESSGLIVALGKWVLRTACHDLQRLVGDRVGTNLCMSVNVSVVQFRHPGFLDIVDEVLRESGIDPRRLELEITESVAMLDANFMLATLNRLKKLGIAIAIDDFGTGFSSLSYLERLNVDRLKIDQSFVNQMMLSDSSLRIVETIVQLGHSLQLQVTAEGVEEPEQADVLQRIGCHVGQGFLFARPLAFEQLHALLAAPGAPVLADHE